MLTLFEDMLISHLKQTSDPAAPIKTGPAFPPSSSANELLSVTASRLETDCGKLAGDNELEYERISAYRIKQYDIVCDGSKIDIIIAGEPAEAITEVLLNGRLLRPGDDFSLDNKTIKFYQVPTGKLLVRTRGEKEKGYQETYPARLTLEICGWEKQSSDSDKILKRALSSILVTLNDIDVIDLGTDVDLGTYYRLIKPNARIVSIERTPEKVGRARFMLSKACLNIDTRLELTLVLGVPEAEGIIEQIHYKPDIKSPGM